MSNRPPLKAARESATKKLIAAHADEHDQYVTEFLNDAGWQFTTVKKEVWRQSL